MPAHIEFECILWGVALTVSKDIWLHWFIVRKLPVGSILLNPIDMVFEDGFTHGKRQWEIAFIYPFSSSVVFNSFLRLYSFFLFNSENDISSTKTMVQRALLNIAHFEVRKLESENKVQPMLESPHSHLDKKKTYYRTMNRHYLPQKKITLSFLHENHIYNLINFRIEF